MELPYYKEPYTQNLSPVQKIGIFYAEFWSEAGRKLGKFSIFIQKSVYRFDRDKLDCTHGGEVMKIMMTMIVVFVWSEGICIKCQALG